MALGLTLGVVLAISGNRTQIARYTSGTDASPSATASPSGVTGAATNGGVSPAASFANGPTALRRLGGLATDPVDGAGLPISLNQTAENAAATQNCTLTVPDDPLSARGLATPYQLGDGCSEQDFATEGAFVEATILAPDGSVQVYDPLVVTAGTTPAAAPVRPRIARGSHVIIDIGFNGNNLVLEGRGARQGNCVDALGQSVIGQVSGCNTVNFYRAANAMIADGPLKVPPIGTSDGGEPCETVRDFALVDQDQSDNVVTTYLLTVNGQTAQDTAANAKSLTGATAIANGSDDRLLANFVDPANGCTAFSATNTTDVAGTSGAQALNELSARVNQTGTIAVVPVNDEMTLVDKHFSIAKTNVYRSLVDQPLLPADVNPQAVAADYCQNMVNIAAAHNQLGMARDLNFASPVPATGDNLATFMGARLAASFGVLKCQAFDLHLPVKVTTAANGVATGVVYFADPQTAAIPDPGFSTSTPAASATPAAASPRRRSHHDNPTGM